jgi:hypothetical protein
MSDSPIKEALSALSRNAQVVEMLTEGGTVLQDAIAKPAATALRQASALRPAGEDSWRLHPRLREYLQDHLQLFPAFQSLKEVGQKILLLRTLREEIDTVTKNRDRESFQSLMVTLSTTLYDIADATESNLAFLTGMVSLKYGTVQTLAAKIAQNRWYERQARILAGDLARLGHQAEALDQEAEARRWDITPLVRRVILSKMTAWQSEVSDVQTRLRTDVFLLRDVEINLRNLARADGYISQQPLWRGPEIELPDDIPPALLRAALPRLRPHVEPQDMDSSVRNDMEHLVAALPPRKVVREKQEAPRQLLVRDEPQDGQQQPADPYASALQKLKASIVASTEPVSLITWHAVEPAATGLRTPAATALRPAVWLMLAVCALEDRPHRLQGEELRFQVDLMMNPAPAGRRLSSTFRDAMVRVAK